MWSDTEVASSSSGRYSQAFEGVSRCGKLNAVCTTHRHPGFPGDQAADETCLGGKRMNDVERSGTQHPPQPPRRSQVAVREQSIGERNRDGLEAFRPQSRQGRRTDQLLVGRTEEDVVSLFLEITGEGGDKGRHRLGIGCEQQDAAAIRSAARSAGYGVRHRLRCAPASAARRFSLNALAPGSSAAARRERLACVVIPAAEGAGQGEQQPGTRAARRLFGGQGGCGPQPYRRSPPRRHRRRDSAVVSRCRPGTEPGTSRDSRA